MNLPMEQSIRRDKIQITVTLEPKTFRRFAIYDTFKRLKRWRMPVVFALIMLAFAAICFAMRDRAQSMLLGSVLAAVGLGLPIVYFGMFFASLNANVKSQKLPKKVYQLSLSGEPNGVVVQSLTDQNERMELKWESLFAAYRDKECIYLYIVPSKAFLLPDDQATATPDELWAFLQRHMPAGRTIG
ncbi:YcxB family protein [Eubacteriales bacterium OttesenSCG-928-N13]|nr:YcxB family protein [Eubacteriales bacterium OttesenSCG-928-N13]